MFFLGIYAEYACDKSLNNIFARILRGDTLCSGGFANNNPEQSYSRLYLIPHDSMASLNFIDQKKYCSNATEKLYSKDFLFNDFCTFATNLSINNIYEYNSRNISEKNIYQLVKKIDTQSMVFDNGFRNCEKNPEFSSFVKGLVIYVSMYSLYRDYLISVNSITDADLHKIKPTYPINKPVLGEVYSYTLGKNIDTTKAKYHISNLELISYSFSFLEKLVSYRGKYREAKRKAFLLGKFDELYSQEYGSSEPEYNDSLSLLMSELNVTVEDKCLNNTYTVSYDYGGETIYWYINPHFYMFSFWLRRDMDGLDRLSWETIKDIVYIP